MSGVAGGERDARAGGERAWTRGARSALEGSAPRGLGCASSLEIPQVRGPEGRGALDLARNGARVCGLFCA